MPVKMKAGLGYFFASLTNNNRIDLVDLQCSVNH
jgi:hypothetical protein